MFVSWQAKQRQEDMEEAIQQAQIRESQIIEMTQWIADVSSLLQSRLDADILAGETPSEFEVSCDSVISRPFTQETE